MARDLQTLREERDELARLLAASRDTLTTEIERLMDEKEAATARVAQLEGALRGAQDGLRYALALMRNRLDVEAPFNRSIIEGYIERVAALTRTYL